MLKLILFVLPLGLDTFAVSAALGLRGLPPRDGLGAAAGRRRDGLRALDGLESAPPGRDLAGAASGKGAGQPVRVALPR